MKWKGKSFQSALAGACLPQTLLLLSMKFSVQDFNLEYQKVF